MAALGALPERFDAGTTVKYNKSFSSYPANGASPWTLKLHVAGIHKDGVANGSSFDVTLDAADTAGLASGTYSWAEVVTRGAEIYTAAEGFVVIDPNPITATAAQSRDPKEALLDTYEAARDALITGKVASYQIGDRAVTYQDLEFIQKTIDRLKREIKANQFPGTLGPTVQVHFTRPT